MHTAKLLSVDYYIDKISLAMQNDAIFYKQIVDAVSILRNFDDTINSFEHALQILIAGLTSTEEYPYDDLLIKIASIFNLSKNFVIDFKNPLTNVIDDDMQANKLAFENFNANVANNTLSTNISLSNNQLRLLIYCAIMKNSYDGSFEMIEKVYATVYRFMAADDASIQGWSIYQMTKYSKTLDDKYIATPASTDCILAYNESYEFIDDPQDPNYESRKQTSQYFTLFFAGFLTIRSVGISYYYQASNLSALLYWAPDNSQQISNMNKWSEENATASTQMRLWL